MTNPHSDQGSPTPDADSTHEKDVNTRPPSLSGESGHAQPMLQKDGVTKIEALCMSLPSAPLYLLG
jgi:hypothetical protein